MQGYVPNKCLKEVSIQDIIDLISFTGNTVSIIDPKMTALLIKKVEGSNLKQYGQDNFNLYRKGLFKSTTSIEKLLSWKKELIKMPLLNMMSELNNECCQLYKNVMSFMGDRESSKPPIDHAYKLINEVLILPDIIHDELYCQIVKQIINNPGEESLEKGWQLIVLCLEFIPPSSYLKEPLMSFCVDKLNIDNKVICRLAELVLHRVPKICDVGKHKTGSISIDQLQSLVADMPSSGKWAETGAVGTRDVATSLPLHPSNTATQAQSSIKKDSSTFSGSSTQFSFLVGKKFSTDYLINSAKGFTLEQYALCYFNFERKGLTKSTTSIGKVLSWKPELIKMPLLNSTTELSQESCQLFKNITGFMGDRESSKPAADHAFKLLNEVISLPDAIHDELYCQIIKQLVNNPNLSSLTKGWQLMLICLEYIPPSFELQQHLMAFCIEIISTDNETLSVLAEFALHRIPQICEIGECTTGCVSRADVKSILSVIPFSFSNTEVCDFSAPLSEQQPSVLTEDDSFIITRVENTASEIANVAVPIEVRNETILKVPKTADITVDNVANDVEKMLNTQKYQFSIMSKFEVTTEEIIIALDGFTFEQYAMIYFNFERKGLTKSTTSIEKILSWKPELIKMPLLNSTSELSQESCQLFKNITGFMGDRESSKPAADHAFKLLNEVISLPDAIHDELYCQIIKQLVNNPNLSSLTKGWQLMLICLEYIPPSFELQEHLMAFCVDNLKSENETISKSAEYVLHRTRKICEVGKHQAASISMEEVQSLFNAISFKVQDQSNVRAKLSLPRATSSVVQVCL